ncbi:hypothetical protein FPV67DRAFT_1454493 [Lyophyllum atratum]|nr:hypothetical protein FPV67DRAFT_1454493 [Lyophyllum atratum]
MSSTSVNLHTFQGRRSTSLVARPQVISLTSLSTRSRRADHIPGVTLCREELHQVFDIIRPHVKRWRAFHLKIRDHECKATARQHLSSCGPAPNLETLQLYHFEDYRTSQNLYLATYRPPVMVFSNELPLLKNVSLIGVNLPWSRSPYLARLHTLELALHPETIRPPYEDWENMLRSPDLQTLSLHYSGPRVADGDTKLVWPASKERIYIESLQNLSLTDLDPDYLCRLMGRLVLPRIKQLSLDLPDQDFTPFVELIARPSPSTQSPISPNSPTPPYPHAFSHLPLPALSRLETLVLTALETSPESLRNLLRALQELRALEVNFACISDALPGLLVEGMDVTEDEDSPSSEVTLMAIRPKSGTKSLPSSCPTLPCNARTPTFKMAGLSGQKVEKLIRYRECQDTGLARRCGEAQRSCGRYGVCRWIVKWSERQRGEDKVLDRLVDDGWVGENGRRVYVETYNEDGDEEMDDDDDEGQAEDDGLDDEAAQQVEDDGDDDEDEDEMTPTMPQFEMPTYLSPTTCNGIPSITQYPPCDAPLYSYLIRAFYRSGNWVYVEQCVLGSNPVALSVIAMFYLNEKKWGVPF